VAWAVVYITTAPTKRKFFSIRKAGPDARSGSRHAVFMTIEVT